jgi:hypothetical protein
MAQNSLEGAEPGEDQSMCVTGIKAIAGSMLIGLTLVSGTCAAHAKTAQSDVLHAIREVRKTTGPNEKMDAAEHLRDVVLAADANDIDDQAIHALASLLDIHLDSVRYWVAEALGHFGPRAKFAAPKLRRILSAEECVIAETSSEDMVRQTLERVGSPVPARKCDHAILPK